MASSLGQTAHAVAGSSKLLATNGGAHIFNILVSSTTLDNGRIIGRGDYIAPEYYAEADGSNTFAGKVIDTAANGNYYVEVTATAGDLLVLQVPLIYENYTTYLGNEKWFYNVAGDIVRCYELAVGDIFELSAEGFTGTVTVGKAVSIDATTKLLVCAQ